MEGGPLQPNDPVVADAVEARARKSLGASNAAVYSMVAAALSRRDIRGGTLVDAGCGAGALRPYVKARFARYIGVDAVRYDGLPDDVEFHRLDLDSGAIPLPDGAADVVAAVETIEHLENPRAFARELARLVKPGGWLVLTTPNNRSLLSLATLALKGSFSQFQDASYPAHLTALLEKDLERIAAETGLTDTGISYSHEGRIALTGRHFPRVLSLLFPRALSDNLLLIGRRGR